MSPRAPDAPFKVLLVACWLLPISSALSAVMILVASGMLVPWWKRERPDHLPVSRLWLALMAAIGASMAFSSHLEISWPALPLAGAYLLVIWAVARSCDSPQRIGKLLEAFFWGAVPWAILGVALVAWGGEWDLNFGGIQLHVGTADRRANSIFLHPNILSGYLVMAMAIGVALLKGRWWTVGPALAILAFCQVLTQSRSGWIGTAVMLVLALILTWNAQSRITPLKVIAGVVAVCAALPLMLPRLSTLFDAGYQSNQGHVHVWTSALEMIKARPMLGWGPGTWNLAYPPFRDPGEFERLPHAHSVFLHLGSEYGLLVLVLLVALFAVVTLGGLRSAAAFPNLKLSAGALAAGIGGYLAMGVFEFTLSEGRNSIVFFATLGLLVALRRLAERNPLLDYMDEGVP